MQNVMKLNNAQLAKLKKSITVMKCHEAHRVEAPNYNICKYVKFGAISWKIDILPVTAYSKFESENSFVHMLLILLWLSSAQQISFLPSRIRFYQVDFYVVNYIFPSPNLRFFSIKSPSVTQRSASQEKKKRLKRENTRRLFFT